MPVGLAPPRSSFTESEMDDYLASQGDEGDLLPLAHRINVDLGDGDQPDYLSKESMDRQVWESYVTPEADKFRMRKGLGRNKQIAPKDVMGSIIALEHPESTPALKMAAAYKALPFVEEAGTAETDWFKKLYGEGSLSWLPGIYSGTQIEKSFWESAAVKRIDEGKATTQDWYLIAKSQRAMEDAQNMGTWDRVGEIAKGLPETLLLFWATGGGSALFKAGAKRMLIGELSKRSAVRATQRLGLAAAGATGRMPTALALQGSANFSQRRTPHQRLHDGPLGPQLERVDAQGIPEAALKAAAGTYFEILSEEVGGELLGRAGGAATRAIRSKFPAIDAFMAAASRKWMSAKPGRTLAQFYSNPKLDAIKKATMAGGPIEESLEERLTEVLNGITTVGDFGTTGDLFAAVVQSDTQAWENFKSQVLAEGITFSALGVGQSSVAQAANAVLPTKEKPADVNYSETVDTSPLGVAAGRKFYSDPDSAGMWTNKNVESARKLLEGRNNQKNFSQLGLPVLSGQSGDKSLRSQFMSQVRDEVNKIDRKDAASELREYEVERGYDKIDDSRRQKNRDLMGARDSDVKWNELNDKYQSLVRSDARAMGVQERAARREQATADAGEGIVSKDRMVFTPVNELPQVMQDEIQSEASAILFEGAEGTTKEALEKIVKGDGSDVGAAVEKQKERIIERLSGERDVRDVRERSAGAPQRPPHPLFDVLSSPQSYRNERVDEALASIEDGTPNELAKFAEDAIAKADPDGVPFVSPAESTAYLEAVRNLQAPDPQAIIAELRKSEDADIQTGELQQHTLKSPLVGRQPVASVQASDLKPLKVAGSRMGPTVIRDGVESGRYVSDGESIVNIDSLKARDAKAIRKVSSANQKMKDQFHSSWLEFTKDLSPAELLGVAGDFAYFRGPRGIVAVPAKRAAYLSRVSGAVSYGITPDGGSLAFIGKQGLPVAATEVKSNAPNISVSATDSGGNTLSMSKKAAGRPRAAGKGGLPRTAPTATEAAQEAGIDSDLSKSISAQDVTTSWFKAFGVTQRQGGFRGTAAGIYKWLNEVIRIASPYLANLAVAAHEIGHHIDKTLVNSESLPEHLRLELADLDYDSKQTRVKEGFAEFVRMWITDQGAKEAAPEFHEWFTEWLDKNPKHKKSFEEARSQSRKYDDQTAFQRLHSFIQSRPGKDLNAWREMKNSIIDMHHKAYQNNVDKFWQLKRIADQAEAQGMSFENRARAYELATATDNIGVSDAAKAIDEGVHTVSEDHRIIGPALAPVVAAVGAEREQASTYALARHALFMNEKAPNFEVGISLDDARTTIAAVRADPVRFAKYEAYAKGISEWFNDLRRMQVDSGLLSQEEWDRMLNYYGESNYFPLHRVKKNKKGVFSGSKYVNLPKGTHRRTGKGSGEAIVDPLDVALIRGAQVYNLARNHQTVKALLAEITPKEDGDPQNSMGRWADRVDPKSQKVSLAIHEALKDLVVNELVSEEDAAAMRVAMDLRNGEKVSVKRMSGFAVHHGVEISKDGTIENLQELIDATPDATATIFSWRPSFSPSPGTSIVRVINSQGKPEMWELSDELYDTFHGSDPVSQHLVMQTIKWFNSFFRLGSTGISTGFATGNIIMDYKTNLRQAKYQGAERIYKPLFALAAYSWWKLQRGAANVKLRKELPQNDLLDFFEEMGGPLMHIVHGDVNQMERYRTRLERLSFLQRAIKFGKRLVRNPLAEAYHVGKTGTAGLREFISWTDVGPRIAEFEATLKHHGYRQKKGKIVDQDGNPAAIPRDIMVKAINAAADVTYNYKRHGSGKTIRMLNDLSPYFNAAIQGNDKRIRTALNLKNIFETNESGKLTQRAKQAQGTLITSAAMGAASVLYYLFRSDDDDYKEMDVSYKARYWTFSFDGGATTHLAIPRSREWGFEPAMVEALMEVEFGDDTDALWDTAVTEIMQSIPSGGGILRAGAEVLHDTNWYTGRPIVGHLSDKSAEYQYTDYTMETSKEIGKRTGLSPVRVEHLLGQATGGALYRWTRTGEKWATGEPFDWSDIPFARGVAKPRKHSKSVNRFYEERNRLKRLKEQDDHEDYEMSPEEKDQLELIEDYAGLMTEIREASSKATSGLGRKARMYMAIPYLVGLSREMLGEESLEYFPSPFRDSDVHPKIKDAMRSFVGEGNSGGSWGGRIRSGMLMYGRTYQQDDESNEDFSERHDAWRRTIQRDLNWLKEHRDLPVVQEQLKKAAESKRFKEMLRGKRPQFGRRKSADVRADREIVAEEQRFAAQFKNLILDSPNR